MAFNNRDLDQAHRLKGKAAALQVALRGSEARGDELRGLAAQLLILDAIEDGVTRLDRMAHDIQGLAMDPRRATPLVQVPPMEPIPAPTTGTGGGPPPPLRNPQTTDGS